MKTRILCAGTFDKLHTGHIQYLKSAKALAEYPHLTVIVGRDANSEKIKNKKPKNNEQTRLKNIKSLDFIDKAVLGNKRPLFISKVASLRPDIIALGHDQWAKEEWLTNSLGERGLNVKVVRMLKYPKLPILQQNP